MGTQISALGGLFGPRVSGPSPQERRRSTVVGRPDVAPGLAYPGRRVPTPASDGRCGRGAACTAGSNEPSNGSEAACRPAVRPARRRRRPRGDLRRPRSGHLTGTGRRVVALPVDCPRPAARPWERWARLGVTLTVVTLLGFGVAAVLPQAGSGVLVPVAVDRGDTLWAIATEYSPDRDPRAVIDEIREVNGLAEGVLPVGLVIQVPSSSPVRDAGAGGISPSVTDER